MAKPIAQFSVSSVRTLNKCPKSWELERVVRAPRRGAWWFVTGRAVHSATEVFDKLPVSDSAQISDDDVVDIWTGCFNDEVHEVLTDDGDMNRWDYGGRARLSARDATRRYYARGLEDFRKYVGWRRANPMDLFAIEEDISECVPGVDLQLKGFIDRVFRDANGQWVIVDIKTGSTKVTDSLQLGFYRVGLALKRNLVCDTGYYWQSKDGALSKPFDLRQWNKALVAQYGRDFKARAESGIYPPIEGEHCWRCSVRDSCYFHSGDTPATRLDPLNPNS